MAAMAGAFFVSKKKSVTWTVFIFATLMGLSRIFLCVHYPSDVVGGIIAGLIAGLVAAALINLLYSKENNKKVKSLIDFDIINVIKKK
jgi:undecaprenyl-diphosphatase